MMKGQNLLKMGLILAAICLVAAAALAVGYRLTKETIEQRGRADRMESLRVVLPAAASFSDLQAGGRIDYYRGLDAGGEVIGYAFPGEAKGYSSVISVMVGVDPAGTIVGIEILDQKETPGLGTQAVAIPATRNFWQALFGRGGGGPAGRPLFQEQFAGKTASRLRQGADIQALTGATITSRAVTAAVKDSLEAFLTQQQQKKE